MRMRMVCVAAVLVFSGWLLTWAGDEPGDAQEADKPATSSMVLPEYDSAGKLLRPDGYERWTMVGTSIGLDYTAGEGQRPPEAGVFHQVYMQPEAFDHYVETGEFAEHTIFVVTNCPPKKLEGDEEIGRHGRYAAPTSGLEVSVYDPERFDDGWGFFMYFQTEGPRNAAKAFPTEKCMDCHAAHGEDNGVFTQFYTVLTQARAKRLAQTGEPKAK